MRALGTFGDRGGLLCPFVCIAHNHMLDIVHCYFHSLNGFFAYCPWLHTVVYVDGPANARW